MLAGFSSWTFSGFLLVWSQGCVGNLGLQGWVISAWLLRIRTGLRMRMNIESDLTCNTWSYGLSISGDTWVPQNQHHFISLSTVPCGERKITNQVFFPPLSRTGSGTHSQIPNPILAVEFFFLDSYSLYLAIYLI